MYIHVANGLLCVHGYTLAGTSILTTIIFVESKLDIDPGIINRNDPL